MLLRTLSDAFRFNVFWFGSGSFFLLLTSFEADERDFEEEDERDFDEEDERDFDEADESDVVGESNFGSLSSSPRLLDVWFCDDDVLTFLADGFLDDDDEDGVFVFCFIFLWNASSNLWSRMFSSGSQVLCSDDHPFHFTKYFIFPFTFFLCRSASAAKTRSPIADNSISFSRSRIEARLVLDLLVTDDDEEEEDG